MCDHCDAITRVLTQLCGPKVATVILKRVEAELHGQPTVIERSMVANLA